MKQRSRDPIGKYGSPRTKVLSVSRELEDYAYDLRERASVVERQQPASIAREMAAEYRFAAKLIEATAKRVRLHANRIGF
jgi:hypothetical protein